jgi:RNA polymerase sigma-70 factor (ECF subfamily)
MLLFVLALGRLFGRRAASDVAYTKQELHELGDEQLMLAYAAGQIVAFEILMNRHQGAVFRFILRSVRNEERAEELTQDTFFRVIKAADRYKESARFTTFLFTIARNICIDESRRARTGRERSLDAPLNRDETGGETLKDRIVDEMTATGAGVLSREQFLERLQEGLDELPEEQREVFILRHIEGMRFVDIAAMFDISENTVKSRMRYALATLRGYVAEFDGHSFDEDEDRIRKPVT